MPTPRLHGYDSSESCIAVLPNTHNVVPSREPIRPAQPLPWSDCYLEATYGFPFPCRITTNKRDYTPVLPVVDDEVLRIKSSFKSHRIFLNDLRHERGADWCRPLDLVEATQLLPATHKPSTARTSGPSPEADDHPPFHHDSEDISVIGSDEEDERLDDESGSDSADDEELEMLLNFEHMMFNTGEVRDPVVNVWYDLDMVTEIVDPVHFLEDVKRLRIPTSLISIRVLHLHIYLYLIHRFTFSLLCPLPLKDLELSCSTFYPMFSLASRSRFRCRPAMLRHTLRSSNVTTTATAHNPQSKVVTTYLPGLS